MFFLYESAFLQFLITSYFIFTGILGYLLFLTNSLLVICLPCSVLTNFLSAVPLFKLFLFCLFSFAISYHLLCQSTFFSRYLQQYGPFWESLIIFRGSSFFFSLVFFYCLEPAVHDKLWLMPFIWLFLLKYEEFWFYTSML